LRRRTIPRYCRSTEWSGPGLMSPSFFAANWHLFIAIFGNQAGSHLSAHYESRTRWQGTHFHAQ
jgi:hypothetical protein